MELKNKINLYISGLNIVEKIILFNITLYLLPFVLKTVLFLFNIKGLSIVNWFTIDATFSEFILKPWSILTYGFIHGSFSHIFWNMLILYYFGNILKNMAEEVAGADGSEDASLSGPVCSADTGVQDGV